MNQWVLEQRMKLALTTWRQYRKPAATYFFFLGFLLRALKSFSDKHEQALDVRVFWKDLRDHRHELQSVHFNQNEIFQFYKEIFGFDSVCRQERLTYAQLSYSSTVA